MNIVKQVNNNECGVCVIAMLYEHYYHDNKKLEILETSKVTENGLSIYDFETLASEFGIFIETFQIDWDEFYSSNFSNFHVALIRKNNGMHYIVFKKNKNNIEIWDPEDGYYTTTAKIFSNSFANIIMSTEKTHFKVNVENIKKINLLQMIDIRFLIISFILNATIIGVSILCANYINVLIDNSISMLSMENLLIISIYFTLIFISNSITKYILNIYICKYIKINYIFLTNNFIKSLKIKNKTFIKKIDKNHFYLIDNCIQTIVTFLVSEINNFLINCTLVFICVIIISTISWLFMFILIISIIFIFFIALAHYKFQQKNICQILDNEVDNSINISNYINYIGNEFNSLIHNEFLTKIKNNYLNFQNIYTSKEKFMTLLNLFEEIFEKITIVIITCVCGYLLIKYNQLSIGYFLFVININILLNENIRKLPLFFLKYAEYKKMSRMFINFVHIGNIKNDGKVELKNIDKITFKNKLNNEIIINNGDLLNENIVGYEKLVETLSNFNHDSKSILINNICTNNYNIITVLDSLIVVNATTKMNKNILLEHLDESFLIEAIKKFNLNLTSKNINISEQQIINLLICCCCKNKIIILNDCMRYINDTNIEYINNEIISTITKNNFLIKYF